MQNKTVKVAVIGCGTIANSAHIPAYLAAPDTEILYFCDIIPERADRAVEKYGCGKAVYDYKEILDDPDLDAVSVCTHNDMHSVIAIDFMKHGKDVLCEKPAARILSEALEMEKVSYETGRILSIGVCNRYFNTVNRIKAMIENGDLGEVYHVYASFRAHRSIPGLGGDFTTFAASGGGALIDWGVHYIDLIMYCLNDPKVLSCSGEAFSKLGVDMKNYVYTSMWAEDTSDPVNGTYDVDDSVVGLIRTDKAVISFNGAWAQNIGINETYIDFMGDKGGIRMQYCGGFTYYTARDGALIEEKPTYRMNEMHRDEVLDFVESVRRGERNRNDIRYAVGTSKIMQAIYDSSAQHKEIVL
ncbi:MAG: Gfo/Idh/MocA family oxidoreductase [Clostridia bacterium]|nr:Gfo/Idh/MocA family oxidoreductase [Clostridia bacterium]MBR5423778.1 Gfo/Idh/MocA family oxidoreductase [Clostridia bacterium]